MLKQSPRVSLAYISLAVLTILVGYTVDRTDTALLLSGYGLVVIAALVIMRDTADGEESLPYYWGMLMRLLLLFSFPALSDDIYRFIWDGRLLLNLTDPYKQLPSEYVTQGIDGLDQALFAKDA